MKTSKQQELIIILMLICISNQQNLRSQWDATYKKSLSLQGSDDGGSIFAGFIAGPILFFLSFVIIWYNQKRAAINKKRYITVQKLLQENNKQQVKSFDQMNEKLVQISNQPRLIHLTGKVTVNQSARDSIANLQPQYSLKLQRSVEVRQYRKVDNKKDSPPQLGWYSYNARDVAGRTNDSACWFLKSQIFTSPNAQIQGYKMNQKQMKSMMTNTKIFPTKQMALSICQQTNRTGAQWLIEGEYLYFPAVPGQKLSQGTLRVAFASYKPDQLSVISSCNQNKLLQPFRIDHYENHGMQDRLCCQGQSCCCACNALGQLLKPIGQVDIVMQGNKSKDQMIQTMISVNKLQTNVLRLIAYLVMVIGIYAFFSPIVQIIGYIPLVGGFIKGVAGGLIFLGAVIVCIPLFLVTFSLAWLVYHPKVGIVLIIVALLITALIIVLDQVYADKT